MAARDRWRIIRGCYLRYLKALDAGGPPRKEYYLAKYLDFVRPYLKVRESTGSSSTFYTPERSANDSRTRKPLHSASAKKRKRDLIQDFKEESQLVEPEEEEEDEELQQQQIVIEDDVEGTGTTTIYCEESGAGDGGAGGSSRGGTTYTLRNGQLVDSSKIHQSPVRLAEQTSTIVARPAQPVVVEEDPNPDLMFFKSLLPQMNNWTRKQRNQFKLKVLTALDEVDDA